MNPSDSTAHHWYGLHLARMGRGQQGLSELERALALDPLSLIIATDVAETYYLLGKPDAAMTRIDEVLALNPDFAQAHVVKGKILEELHRYQEAEMSSRKRTAFWRRGQSRFCPRPRSRARRGAETIIEDCPGNRSCVETAICLGRPYCSDLLRTRRDRYRHEVAGSRVQAP